MRMCERTQFGSRARANKVLVVDASKTEKKNHKNERMIRFMVHRVFGNGIWDAGMYGVWMMCAARSQPAIQASSCRDSTSFSRNGKMQLKFLFSPSFIPHSLECDVAGRHRRNKSKKRNSDFQSLLFLSLKTRSWALLVVANSSSVTV